MQLLYDLFAQIQIPQSNATQPCNRENPKANIYYKHKPNLSNLSINCGLTPS